MNWQPNSEQVLELDDVAFRRAKTRKASAGYRYLSGQESTGHCLVRMGRGKHPNRALWSGLTRKFRNSAGTG